MTESFPNDPSQQRAFRAFEALVSGGDASLDLSLAALLIACTEYPDLDIIHYLAQLDALALRVRTLLNLPPALASANSPQTPIEEHPLDVIAAMNEVLFQQEHFHGNTEDYYNPANSFLNDVLVLQRDFTSAVPVTGPGVACDGSNRQRSCGAADRRSTPARQADPARAGAKRPVRASAPERC
jgi:hypothetical protein